MATLGNTEIVGTLKLNQEELRLNEGLNIKGKSFTYDELIQAIEFKRNLLNFLENETDINIQKFYEYEDARNLLEKLNKN